MYICINVSMFLLVVLYVYMVVCLEIAVDGRKKKSEMVSPTFEFSTILLFLSYQRTFKCIFPFMYIYIYICIGSRTKKYPSELVSLLKFIQVCIIYISHTSLVSKKNLRITTLYFWDFQTNCLIKL